MFPYEHEFRVYGLASWGCVNKNGGANFLDQRHGLLCVKSTMTLDHQTG